MIEGKKIRHSNMDRLAHLKRWRKNLDNQHERIKTSLDIIIFVLSVFSIACNRYSEIQE